MMDWYRLVPVKSYARYWVTQKLPQIYTAKHATFPIQVRKNTVQICGNFWVTQYIEKKVFQFYATRIIFVCACIPKQLVISKRENGIQDNL